MAKPFDLIFAPEDHYRVVLLQTALAEAGMPVTLRNRWWRRRSNPCLCVLSENSKQWMEETLKFAHESLIWIRLDDTELPLQRGGTLDLRSWPGRSADGALTELVGVLEQARKPKVTLDEGQRRNRTVLGVLAFVLALAFLLPSLSPDNKEQTEEEVIEFERMDEWEGAPINAPSELTSRHMGYADPRSNPQTEESEAESHFHATDGIKRTGIPAKNDREAEVIVGEVVDQIETATSDLMCIAPPNYKTSGA